MRRLIALSACSTVWQRPCVAGIDTASAASQSREHACHTHIVLVSFKASSTSGKLPVKLLLARFLKQREMAHSTCETGNLWTTASISFCTHMILSLDSAPHWLESVPGND
jgi:hypothetical protein